MIRTRFKHILCSFLGLIIFLALSAQEIKSVKSSFRMSNLPKRETEKAEVSIDPDTIAPALDLITPKIYSGTRYYSQQNEIVIIGKASDNSGISFVSVNSELQIINESGFFTARLTLEPGDNQVRIVAIDKNENLKEVYFQVNYSPAVLSLAERISSESRYFALIIGIDKYQDPDIKNLDNPVRDARKLFVTITNKYNFEEENVWVLENATRDQIIRSLDDLSQLISSEDNLLIFYAGHGSWDPDANNGFWLPSDADSDVKTNWLRNSTLVDYVKEINSHHTLLIADACFGGSIFKTRSAFGNRDKAFEKLYELPSRKAMTSGNLTEVPDKSSFTSFLILRLEENNETYLSSEQLFSSFRIAVINNSDAIPMFGEIDKVGDQGGDFIFLNQ